MIDFHQSCRRFSARPRDNEYVFSSVVDARFALRELGIRLPCPEHLLEKCCTLSLVGKTQVAVTIERWATLIGPLPPGSWCDFAKLDEHLRYIESRGHRVKTADGQWVERTAEQAARALIASMGVSAEEAQALLGAAELRPWTLSGKGPRSWQL